MRSLSKPLCLFTLSLLTGGLSQAQISALPYVEDFEVTGGGFTQGGSNPEWQWGMPANIFINQAGQGARSWVTDLDGDFDSGGDAFLESLEFDFTGLTSDPQLQFRHAYELLGTGQAWISLSIDGGPFTKLTLDPSGSSVGWYNNPSAEAWTGISESIGTWFDVRHPLTGTAGKRVRIRWEIDHGGLPGEGWGIDEVRVYTELTDLQATGLVLPNPDTELGVTPIFVEVENRGSTPINGFQVAVQVNGPIPASFVENINLNLASLASATVPIQTPIDFSADGSYSVTATVTATGDQDPANDAANQVLLNQSTIGSFPYLEEFESGNGGFASGGILSSWEWGAPTGGFINAAASGSNAWVTNLDGPYVATENSYLQSPEFDFTGLQYDPFLEFSHSFDLGNFDGHRVEYSVNGGAFGPLGSSGDPVAQFWYSGFGGLTWSGSSGPAGTWRTARHIVPNAAGNRVVFRFVLDQRSSFLSYDGAGIDDVRIYEAAFGGGESSAPGVSLLDVNDSEEVLGFPISEGQPGPYFSSPSPGSGFTLFVESVPLQPILVYSGQLSPGLLSLPGIGQVDLDQFQLFASGLLPTGINPFFVTGEFGTFELTLSVPPTLIGSSSAFQAVVFDSIGQPRLTNAVQVSFVP